MTQIPPGWYPDPAPGQPDVPQGQRYWDGRQWTEHVAPGTVQTAPYPAQQPGRYSAGQPAPYGGQYAANAGPRPATTPDGQRLSGWWRRVGAFLIDKVILGIITLAVGFPYFLRFWHAYVRLIDQAQTAARTGTQPAAPASMLAQSGITGAAVALGLIGLGLGFAYHVGFLKWKQATPGKLAVGLRVRLRETPGPLSWGTCVLRWLAQFGLPGLVQLIPFVGFVGGLYWILDDLWPLWDPHNQAVHDKAAKTNVVYVRP